MTHADSTLGTVFVIAIGSVVAALLSGEQWLAWLLLGATLIVPLGFSSIRDDGRLATVVYLVIACHHGLAVLLTFGEFRPIDLWDATYFDTLASWAAERPEGSLTWELGYLMYVNVLSGIYDINNAFFTGAEVSVLFAVIGLLLMIQIAREIKVPDERLWWVALAGFIPGSLVFFSITYRESLLASFLLLSVWAAIRVLQQKDRRWWVLFVGALVAMGLLHKALFLYSLFVVIVTIMFVVFTEQRTLAWWGKAIGVGAGIVLCVAGVIAWATPEFVKFLEPAIRLIDVDILEQITFYRERMVNWGSPRTDYGLFYDWTDWHRTAVTLGSIYLHYLFSPFDGITRWVDLYAVAE
ncbi:MAG TPA: hypothetical protein EYQ32_11535, partial [Gammaproteobacteria bacterium]|nr:hypothetical protein [Gammaproteobacteria bacterium]